MLIDWFTVGAQVLNFLILVWLLKRFLYKPILNAIDAREKGIATKLADAAAKEAEAQKERDAFQVRNEAFDRQRDELLSKAQDEVETERQRLLEDVRQAADALRTKRQDGLNREQQSLNDEIVRRTREEVFAMAQKTLTDLAGVTLEARMIEVFAHRLRELKKETKPSLTKALTASTEHALVRSAFDLSEEQRAAIQQAVNETFSADVRLRFETAPDVISGIEFIANGQKIAWSIADHLAKLGESVRDLLQEQAKSPAKPEGNAKDKPETSEQGADHR